MLALDRCQYMTEALRVNRPLVLPGAGIGLWVRRDECPELHSASRRGMCLSRPAVASLAPWGARAEGWGVADLPGDVPALREPSSTT